MKEETFKSSFVFLQVTGTDYLLRVFCTTTQKLPPPYKQELHRCEHWQVSLICTFIFLVVSFYVSPLGCLQIQRKRRCLHSATALAAVKSGGDFLELVKSSAHRLYTVQFFTPAISERMKQTCPVTLATFARKSRCQDLYGLVDSVVRLKK